jgi:hypothetical protein
MKTYKLLVVALAMVSAPAHAWAQDQIKLGQPAYGGPGCPAGTASATLSPDSSALSILFDQYVVEAGRSAGRRIARKGCNVAIPVIVPQGFSVSIFSVDYRGFNSIPYGAQSRFNVEYFFAGSQGPRYTKTFMGPVNDNYLLNNTLMASALIWSRCGEQVTLRSNSDMMVMSNSRMEDAMSTVDSIDIEAGLVYHLQWKRCN